MGFSDHSLIYIVRKINNPFKHKRKKEVEIRNFKNFNSEHFLEDLGKQPWGEVEYETDVNAMWTRWKTLFLEVLDRHAPIILRRVRNRSSLPWLSKDIRENMLERDRLKRVAIIKDDESHWKKYKSSRNAVNIAIRRAKSDYYATQIRNESGDPKRAWKTVNDILGRKQQENCVNEIRFNDHSITSPDEIAQTFNEYFTSIGPRLAANIDKSELSYTEYVNRAQSRFQFDPVDASQVYKLLQSLSIS